MPPEPMPEPAGPLTGLRVVDLTWMLAGPYCTMLLADLGADVVKVESPAGDPMRRVGPFRADDRLRAYGGYFQSVNRNKRSVVLDLKSEEGTEAFFALVRVADVLVENFRAGVMERLGLGYERLREENRRLVYAAIRGFGDARTGKSPHLHRPAVDVTVQAIAGLAGITGFADRPLKAGPGVGDIFPAALCAVGILAASRHAERTGEGQFLDVSLYDGVLSLCERIVYQRSYTDEVPRPQGSSHPFFCPFDIFPTEDGHVAVCASEDAQWAALCEAMRMPELALDPRYRTPEGRREHADEVRALVARWTASRPSDEVVALVGGDVPVGPVNTIDDIRRDPHVAAREMLVEVEHPGCDTPVTIAGSPIKLTASPGGVRRRAPLLGEHTEDVLEEVGTATARGSAR